METKSKTKTRRIDAAAVKWIVGGAVLIAFMFLFRPELGRLLDRTSDVSISAKGVEIKTVDTPMGKAEVSVTPTPAAQTIPGISGNAYTNAQFKFRITWPDTTTWTAHEHPEELLNERSGVPIIGEMKVVVARNQPVASFRPNVYVSVTKTVTDNVDDFMLSGLEALKAKGWEIISTTIDNETQSGFIIATIQHAQQTIHQYARVIRTPEFTYMVVANQLPPNDQMPEKLKDALLKILNSFQVVV